jgi:thiol-disulfide isomerase/thioredoxin
MVFLNVNETGKIDDLKRELNNKEKHVFILIYMEGCGPCNQVRPEWKKLENVLKKYNENKNVVIVDLNKDYVDEFKEIKPPNGFPTIRYMHNGTEENYEDSLHPEKKDRSLDSFVGWIEGKLDASIKGGVGGGRLRRNKTKKGKRRTRSRRTHRRRLIGRKSRRMHKKR